jgi:hypothetical protein
MNNFHIIKYIKILLIKLIYEFMNLLFLEILGICTHGVHQRFRHGLARSNLGVSWLNLKCTLNVTLNI